MAALTADTARTYEAGIAPVINDITAVASTTTYEGSCMELESGLASPYDGTGSTGFAGFALRGIVSTASGGEKVRVVSQGVVTLDVVDSSAASVGSLVYATDDNTFTVTVADPVTIPIGKVLRHVTGTTCQVYFTADALSNR